MLFQLLRFAEPDYGLLVGGFFFIFLSSLFKLAIPNFASRCLTSIIEKYATDTGGALSSPDFVQNVFFFAVCALGERGQGMMIKQARVRKPGHRLAQRPSLRERRGPPQWHRLVVVRTPGVRCFRASFASLSLF
jgi:ABC-type multidrug transport system fused ATPase/permease subunit